MSARPAAHAFALLVSLALVGGCTADVALSPISKDTDKRWSKALKHIATPAGMRTDRLEQHRPVLEAYLGWASIHGQHTNSWGESKEDKRLSYLLNVHNAAILHSLLRHGLPDAPDAVKVGLYRWPGAGMAWGSRYRVDNEWTTLAHMASHDTVSRYMEPLLWMGLYDGTQDAPPLRWWSRGKLQPQLKRAARRFINSDRGMAQTSTGWSVNPLFIEHEADFVDWTTASSLCEWLAIYAEDARKAWLIEQAETCTLTTWTPRRDLDRSDKSGSG
jgi:hypothetical protein